MGEIIGGIGAVLRFTARIVGGVVRTAGHAQYRRHMWPLMILAALALARVWAENAGPFVVFGVAVVTGGAVLAYLTARLTRPLEWGYALTCLGATVTGLTLVSVAGSVHWLNVASVIAWAGLSMGWWLHTEPATAQPAATVDTGIVAEWNAHIRDGHGFGAGATLTDPIPFEHGNTHTISVVPAKQHLGTFEANIKSITTALNIPLHKLILEQHPDHPDTPRLLRLQHITKSPIEQAVYFTGPKIEDGRITLGPYADGMGTASWRMFTPNSMWGGFVLGDTGAGKSRLLELIALAARSMGVFLIYIDGQNGASSSTLWRHADWCGGTKEAAEILAAVERGKDARQVFNRVNRLPGFTPSPQLPGILVIIDEAHKIYHPGTAMRWADLARELRKVGGAQLAASQFSGLSTFGGHDVLRSSLLAGNAVALRTSSNISAQLIPGLEVNPALFPSLPGYGYYVDASGRSRTAPFRSEWLPDEEDKTKNPNIPVPTVEEWFERTPAVELDEMTARAFGPAFTDRHELAAKRDVADRAWLAGETEPESADTIEVTAHVAEHGTLGTGPDLWVADRDISEARRVEISDTAAAVMALPGDGLSLADIIDGLAKAGRYPSVATMRAAVKQLADQQLITWDGRTLHRQEAA